MTTHPCCPGAAQPAPAQPPALRRALRPLTSALVATRPRPGTPSNPRRTELCGELGTSPSQSSPRSSATRAAASAASRASLGLPPHLGGGTSGTFRSSSSCGGASARRARGGGRGERGESGSDAPAAWLAWQACASRNCASAKRRWHTGQTQPSAAACARRAPREGTPLREGAPPSSSSSAATSSAARQASSDTPGAAEGVNPCCAASPPVKSVVVSSSSLQPAGASRTTGSGRAACTLCTDRTGCTGCTGDCGDGGTVSTGGSRRRRAAGVAGGESRMPNEEGGRLWPTPAARAAATQPATS